MPATHVKQGTQHNYDDDSCPRAEVKVQGPLGATRAQPCKLCEP